MLVPLLAVGSLIGISWAFPAALYVLLPLLIVAATAYIYLAYIKDWFAHIDPRIPRAPATGILGSVVYWDRRHHPLNNVADARRLGPLYASRVLWSVNVIISDPEISLQVMQRCTEKPDAYNMLIPLVGRHSLVLIGGDEWRTHRSILQKAFHSSYNAFFMDCMVDASRALIRFLSAAQRYDCIDLDHHFTKLSIRVIAQAMFTKTWEGAEGDELIAKLLHLIEALSRKLREPWQFINPFFLADFKATAKFLRNNFQNVLLEHRTRLAEEANNPDKPKRRMDIVDVMLSEKEDGKGLTDESIVDQIMTFFFAGHDTSAHTLSWAVYHISMQPDIEAKVLEEVDRVLGDKEDLKASDTSNLTDLACVVKETLRFNPPVASFNRLVPEDMEIAGYKFTKGSSLATSVLAIHYNEDIYPDPYRFDPDRWQNRTPNHTWLPFTYLQRTCIGRDFALLELRVVLALLYQKFTFRVDSQRVVGPQSRITTVPFEGMRCYVRPRKKQT